MEGNTVPCDKASCKLLAPEPSLSTQAVVKETHCVPMASSDGDDAQAPEKMKEIIKQTVPVLADRAVDITTHFYEVLFKNSPELKGVFNMSHQVKDEKGSAPQPRALAAAIHAYAANIEDLSPLTPTVQRIAHKHVSLGITPEQYQVVGQNLLLSMKEVLGDAATPEVIEAWAQAYDALAKVFIDTEEAIRKDIENRPGGWRNWRKFTVIKKVPESNIITSFYLKPSDGKPICPYSAGQYTCLCLHVPNQEYTVQRNYTISCPPGEDYLRISVKKQEPVYAGAPLGIASHYLHEEVEVGDELELAPPCGDLVLDEDHRPLVLLSAGVGLTPMVSMLHEAIAGPHNQRRIFYIHGARDLAAHALKDEVEAVAQKHPNVTCHFFYTQAYVPGAMRGRMTAAAVQKIVGDTNCTYYLCGPEYFLNQMSKGLASEGVEPANIKCHTFGPNE